MNGTSSCKITPFLALICNFQIVRIANDVLRALALVLAVNFSVTKSIPNDCFVFGPLDCLMAYESLLMGPAFLPFGLHKFYPEDSTLDYRNG